MLVHPEESTMSQLLSRSGNMPTHFPEKTLNLRPGSGSLNFDREKVLLKIVVRRGTG
jgi:hypothetical protein